MVQVTVGPQEFGVHPASERELLKGSEQLG